MKEIHTFIPEIISAHFDEAAYLYSEFLTEVKALTQAPVYLKDVVARMEANLEGLTINATAASEFCCAALEGEDAGEFFVASYLSFHSGELARIKPLVETAQSSTSLLEAVAYGLTWHKWELCGFWAAKFISAKQTAMAAIGLFCFNTYQKPLPIRFDDLLKRALGEVEPVALPLLLAIAQKNKDVTLLPILQQENNLDALGELQFEQLKTRLKLGDQSALVDLKKFVLNDNAYRDSALELAFSQLEKNDAKQWIAALKQTKNAERYVLLAVGILNEQILLPWVVKQMQEPALARIAGKVFSQLSGHNLRKNGWIMESDVLDEQWLAFEGDEDLDWPDVVKITEVMGLELSQ